MDHIQHYRIDAQVFDYFELNPYMVQEYRRRYEGIFHQLDPSPGSCILEIGTGGGPACQLVKQYQVSHISVDLSLLNLQRLNCDQVWTEAVCTDALTLPFVDQSISHIIISEVLEHIPDPVKALTELYRVLKPGGKLLVSVPWREKIAQHLCIHCNRPTPSHAHLHSIDEIQLAEWLKQAGFSHFKMDIILNKVINRFAVNRLLSFLPYRIWVWIDSLANHLICKPVSLFSLAQK